MSEHNDFLERLERRIWITRGSRFNAARRLSNKQYWSIASISVLSVYGISIPIIQTTFNPLACQEVNRAYFIISTISSIFILVLSLLEGSKNYQVKADRLYSNALHLSRVSRKIVFFKLKINKKISVNIDELVEISDEYERLVFECSENHETEDFRLFQIQNRVYFGISPVRGFLDSLLLYIKDYWLYIISIIVFPVPIIFLYFSC
jgi:hypothetical protein